MRRPRAFARLLFVASLLAAVSLACPALAQSGGEAPYTPRMYPRAELINFGTYDEPPLTFEWEPSEVRQEPVHQRLDFVLTLEADFSTVVDFFQTAYTEQTPVATLASGILVFQPVRELVVIGQSGETRFSLGARGMTHRFVIDISNESGQAVITLKNMVSSQLFSGVVPARVGFQPAGAEPVNLLWN